MSRGDLALRAAGGALGAAVAAAAWVAAWLWSCERASERGLGFGE